MNQMLSSLLPVMPILVGCIDKPFQPIPPIFTAWSMPGKTSEDVKRALAACGFQNVGTGFDVNDMRTGRVSQNDFVQAEVCMEKNGYSNESGRSACSYSFNAKLPACHQR